MAAIILQLKDLKPGRFPHLRYVTNTAAALPPAHIARLQELFPSARLFSMYGLTECKRCTYLPPAELLRPAELGRHRHPRHRGLCRRRARAAARRPVAGELVIRGAARHAGLLGEPGGHRRRPPAGTDRRRKGSLHRRHLPHGRGRLPLFRRAQGRHHQVHAARRSPRKRSRMSSTRSPACARRR